MTATPASKRRGGRRPGRSSAPPRCPPDVRRASPLERCSLAPAPASEFAGRLPSRPRTDCRRALGEVPGPGRGGRAPPAPPGRRAVPSSCAGPRAKAAPWSCSSPCRHSVNSRLQLVAAVAERAHPVGRPRQFRVQVGQHPAHLPGALAGRLLHQLLPPIPPHPAPAAAPARQGGSTVRPARSLAPDRSVPARRELLHAARRRWSEQNTVDRRRYAGHRPGSRYGPKERGVTGSRTAPAGPPIRCRRFVFRDIRCRT